MYQPASEDYFSSPDSFMSADKSDQLGGGTVYPATDWGALKHGDQLLKSSGGKLINSGRVDAVTSDGSILWILPNGAATRKMHHRIDQEEFWSYRQTVRHNYPSNPEMEETF